MTNLRFILASLVLGASAVAHAETAPAASRPVRPTSPVMAALDTDRNGVLSAAEIAAAPGALTALDLNEDGFVTPDELRATAPASSDVRAFRVSRLASGLNLVVALDANHDGDIQPMEIANAVSSLKRLDLNGDGLISRDELRLVPARRNATT